MATSIIKLHTLSGASDDGPPCFILQIDHFHCLLDCGWVESAHGPYPTELKKWIKHLDAVFISHATPRHCGFLPLLVAKYGLRCPIYSTIPTARLGQLFLYDLYQSIFASQDYDVFSLDDVDDTFDRITTLKYQQPLNLTGRGHGITVTPLQSGHVLGGTIWRFLKDDTDIVYAVDFNHKRERHLNGAAFDACMRPYLLIMDASNALYTPSQRAKDKDDFLKSTIAQTLKNGGNVLIPVDTAGRCLEIAHFLETCWHSQDAGLMPYGLAMLSNVSFNVVDFSKTMIEWMSDKMMKTFEDQRVNPFAFRHMQLCHTLDQLDLVPEPKVVLASLDHLQFGFARQLFAEWCTSEKNTVILTSRSRNPLMQQLVDLAESEKNTSINIPFVIRQRVLVPAEEYSRSATVPFLEPDVSIKLITLTR
ncbi:hypothetical protein Ciccas_008309 [Cichlidogyrus casuarinus]|uniref:Cleavage and polyadenylation specificity factor subunit 2 n=1 Tax=Cichlidogyrus casuarinus TaxID=1844966 RepID=A0ABD2Q139_9PLAT